MSITNYLNLITSEHRSQSNFTSWLSSALQKVDDLITMTNSIETNFDIDNAVGVQLDTLGQIIGVKRNIGVPLSGASSILDDTHYRILLRAKIARNQWDGTIPQIYSVWKAAFPNSQLQIIDNQDMTMQAVVTGLNDSVSLELVTLGLIIPKPAGVSLTVIGNTTISDTAYFGGLVTGMDTTTITTNTPVIPNNASVALTFTEQ